MKFGVREGMVKADWATVHEVAGQLGFDGVELEVGPKAPEEGTPLFDTGEREKLKSRMKACGVVTSAVCIGGFWRYGPAEDDAALRNMGKDMLRKTLEACADIGAKHILTPLNHSGQTAEVAVARWEEFLQELKSDCEASGVTVGLEACGRPGLRTDADMKSLIDKTGSPAIRAYMDVGNITAAGVDPASAIRMLGTEYISHIHMKDRKENPPGSERSHSMVGLGEGSLDFKGITDAIREIGYDDWLTLETPAGEDARASAKRNLEFLKGFYA